MSSNVGMLLVENERFMKYIASRLVGNNYHEIEDLVSASSIMALESQEEFNPDNYKFTTWIKYIIMSCRSFYKFGVRTKIDNVTMSLPDDMEVVSNDFSETMVLSELQSMPHPVVAMYRHMGYGVKETAELLDEKLFVVERQLAANKKEYEKRYGMVETSASHTLNLNKLNDYFSYDQATGEITWKKRPSRSKYKAGSLAGCNQGASGIIGVQLEGVLYLNHRIAWAISNNKSTFGEITHVNGDKSDNRIANLKELK